MLPRDTYVSESLRSGQYSFLSGLLSPFLMKHLAGRGMFTLEEFRANGRLDFTRYLYEITGITDFAGIHMLAPGCLELTLPVITDGRLGNSTTLTPITITPFTDIEILSQNITGGGGTYQAFRGDLSAFTRLVKVEMAVLSAEGGGLTKPIMPVLANNPNLEVFYLAGTGTSAVVNTATVGNLSGNMKLKQYRLTFAGTAQTSTFRALVDNVLSTLRAQKAAGGAIQVIDFNGSLAPTAGASNADYLWLIANGVTVTLGTL